MLASSLPLPAPPAGKLSILLLPPHPACLPPAAPLVLLRPVKVVQRMFVLPAGYESQGRVLLNTLSRHLPTRAQLSSSLCSLLMLPIIETHFSTYKLVLEVNSFRATDKLRRGESIVVCRPPPSLPTHCPLSRPMLCIGRKMFPASGKTRISEILFVIVWFHCCIYK